MEIRFYLFAKELKSCLSGPRAQPCAPFMKILTVYTLNSHLLTLKDHITKSCMLLLSAEIFEASSTNSVDPDQAAPVIRTGALLP